MIAKKPVSHEPVLSGALGIVIIPDQETVERAYALAAEIFPSESEFILGAHSIPHVTLYHGKLQGAPACDVFHVLSSIRELLVGKQFSLGSIVAFGGNFVFWNIEQNVNKTSLDLAHREALSMATFLDRTAEAKATSEEALVLSEEELENVKHYGHPLAGRLYTPHITLGFHRGIARHLKSGLRRESELSVAAVELARIGYPGRVESIVDLVKAV